MAEISPMMSHYLRTKEDYKDCILFYRLGDFYEMFFDDALTTSKELELTLTGKSCGMEERAPMCGVPFHSANVYIAKLVERGYKVAICEQVEDPKSAKGIVKREVTRVITPGTVLDETMLDEKKNNYLSVINLSNDCACLAFCDVSTGEIYLTDVGDISSVMNELARYSPSEILINSDGAKELSKIIDSRLHIKPQELDEDYFYSFMTEERIKNQFKKSLEELGLKPDSPKTATVYAMLRYLDENQKDGYLYINKLKIYSVSEYMDIDIATRRNLEITETMREKKKKGSLLGVLDYTKTSMGARKLVSWLEKPLVNPININKRLYSVKELADNPMMRDDFANALNGIYDISRIVSRIATNTLTPKDLVSLKQSLLKLPQIEYLLSQTKSPMLSEMYQRMDILSELAKLLEESIDDEASTVLRGGKIIKEGYNKELETYRDAMNNGKGWIARVEAEEKEKTGIKTLKTGYNKVFGYYIEVTKLNSADVPDYYIRKQTLTNAERYITPELKEIEETILCASEKFEELELKLYEEIRLCVMKESERLRNVSEIIATIDVLYSFAVAAYKNNYTMPEITTTNEISITDGRHPVVETMLNDSLFVPNDTNLDSNDARLLIITGPNMAGKSTYMRQVALISLMAQVGSFVPASYAKLCAVDKIFTRVGASDDISAGQSTFMLEMVEVANILKNATDKSLVILDEIGRGTSTYDGLSIAWAVAEYVNNKRKIGAKTLFATHYHELSELEEKLDGVMNYRIAVKKRGDDITFLRKIVRGGADDSFGIEVAKLAGLPDEVIKRAKEILSKIENDDTQNINKPKKQEESEFMQLSFEDSARDEIMNELKTLDVTTLTPIEAMTKLYEMANKAKNN
ncbi:MAG: DNA mismatch repair protein MutS [Clostridia bacterium]|nr:DNA mismatch repair protein MutS [Clostridia bacterium]